MIYLMYDEIKKTAEILKINECIVGEIIFIYQSLLEDKLENFEKTKKSEYLWLR